MPHVEAVLGEIKDAGGLFTYIFDSEGSADVLFIKTADAREMVKKNKTLSMWHNVWYFPLRIQASHFDIPQKYDK